MCLAIGEPLKDALNAPLTDFQKASFELKNAIDRYGNITKCNCKDSVIEQPTNKCRNSNYITYCIINFLWKVTCKFNMI